MKTARIQVLTTAMWKSSGFLSRIFASDTEASSWTLSYVCPDCGLFPIHDFIWWVTGEHGEKEYKEEAVQLVVCGVCRVVRLVGSKQGTDDSHASNRASDTWVFRAHARPPRKYAISRSAT